MKTFLHACTLLLALGFASTLAQANGGARPSNETFSKAFGEKRAEWAIKLFQKYSSRYKSANKEFFIFVDYKRHASKRRFYIVYPKTGKALGYHTAHGSKSDLNKDGYVERLSNRMSSFASSQGVFLTKLGKKKSGKFGHTIHVQGLSSSNSRAHTRKIRVHPALRWCPKDKEYYDYVKAGEPSGGCFALRLEIADDVMNKLATRRTFIIATLDDKIR
jgi:hypothetical protein